MENMIKVTGVDLVKLIQAAYNFSGAVGMGFLHYTEKPLSDEEAQQLIRPDDQVRPSLDHPDTLVHMDYIKGRCCKFSVFKDCSGDLWVRNKWYDHGDTLLQKMLESVGVEKQGQTHA